MRTLLLIFYFLLYAPVLNAGECDVLLSADQLKKLLKTSNFNLLSNIEKKDLSFIYPHMRLCPDEYLALPLAKNEKENLKKYFQKTELDQIASYIIDNLSNIDLDQEIEHYKKVFHAVHGKSANYGHDMRTIIDKRDAFLMDKKNICSEANVDTTNMGPVRDQQNTNWCFAYAAADIYSFYAKQTISGLDMAILNNNFSVDRARETLFRHQTLKNYTDQQSPHMLHTLGITKETIEYQNTEAAMIGGYPGETIKIGLQKGLCLEKDLPSSHQDGIALTELAVAAANYKTYKFDGVEGCVNRLSQAQKLLKNLSVNDIHNIIEKSDYKTAMLNLRNKNCKNLVYLKNKKVTKSDNIRDQFNLINRKLNQKEPVIVGYRYSMIDGETSSGHGSVIIGRRFNEQTKRCEYKIRNSFGTSYLHSKLVKSSDGHFWVGEENLKNNLISTTAMD